MFPPGVQVEMGSTLILADVDRHVEGGYTCTASNGVGEPSSATMTLLVDYPPEIITEKVRTRFSQTMESWID